MVDRAARRKRIVFVINSIGLGGAERALGTILAHIGPWRDRFDVHLVLLDRLPETRAMPEVAVKHTLDGRGGLLRSLVQLAACLHRLEPDLCVSFLVRANVANAVLGRFVTRCPTVICERMHLSSHLDGKYRGWKRLAAGLTPRLAYRFATRVLGVSSGVTEDLIARFGVDSARAGTIFNPFDLDRIAADGARAPEFALPEDFLVAVGRLMPGKNYPHLLDAYAASGVDLPLVILGEGEDRAAIEAHTARLGIADRVRMPGYAANPFAVVARARAYVSASRNEGFPNAMVEAMALGVPVLSTDCRSGPAEILAGIPRLPAPELTEADHGILVPEDRPDLLAEALRRIVRPATRAHYAERAARRSRDFRAEAVAGEYWSLFERLAWDRQAG